VNSTADLSGARLLWQRNVYDLVMLDLRRYSRGEALEFYERIRDASPQQRIVFLVGPPTYLSLTWTGEVAVDDTSHGQWGETVKTFFDRCLKLLVMEVKHTRLRFFYQWRWE
jgi:hypothetical protein